MRVSASDVVTEWRKWTTRIDARYATGTAQHESSFDTEQDTPNDGGSTSYGLFQIKTKEKILVGMPDADLHSLEGSCKVFAALQEYRLDALLRVTGPNGEAMPDESDPGWRAYLTVAHNQGTGAAKTTLEKYGFDWAAYVARNQNEVHAGFNGPAIVAYGNDAISGGEEWSDDFNQADRVAADGQPTITAADESMLRWGGVALAALVLLRWV